jgi:hypothetical protein
MKKSKKSWVYMLFALSFSFALTLSSCQKEEVGPQDIEFPDQGPGNPSPN